MKIFLFVVGNRIAATADAEIEKLLDGLYEAHLTLDEFDPFKVGRIRRAIEQLKQSNRVQADCFTASLEGILCNYEGAQVAIDNIKANRAFDKATVEQFRLDSNFLYASKARELASDALRVHTNHDQIFFSCVTIGAFQTICDAIDRANEERRVILANSVIPLSRKAVAVLQALDVTERDVAACIDVAGEMLRARRLMWLDNAPNVHITGDAVGEPGIALDYKLAVNPADAASLTWELCERLIDRDLYRLGVTIGFVGVR